MANLTSTELKRLHRGWRRRNNSRLSLALEGVQGPFNVGAAIRTAAAYRAEELLLCAGATGPENTKVGKTALGTDRYMRVLRFDTVDELISHARGDDKRVIGVELAQEAMAIHTAELRGSVCLLLGNEDRGLSTAALAGCDDLVFIPQFGKVGSLNVATAASIATYEWARQQITGSTDPGA